jgi:spermidine synthase
MSHKKSFVSPNETYILILSTFIAGLCSIVYELLISTASSYFLGDSIKQFSITIGCYMAAMGIGSYLSRLIKGDLLSVFIVVEIFLGFLGGMCIPVLYFIYAFTDLYVFSMIFLIFAVGILIGLEIPLLTRIMDKYYALKLNISNVLSLDYLGALVATLLFPFVLLPLLGTFRSSLFFGVINMGIGFMNLWCFWDRFDLKKRKVYLFYCVGVSAVLFILLFLSPLLLRSWSNHLYEDHILLSKQSKFQKIVLTKDQNDVRLFINGNLQFSSIDEYRYHEVLVHPALSVAAAKNTVLLLGGGDGLVCRELLKYEEIQQIFLVDIDPEITKLAQKNNYLKRLNADSLRDARVKIFHEDANVFLKETPERFDVIIADLPDPNNISLARLYSLEFYRLVRKRLARGGVFVTQATSPYYAKHVFWCINETLSQAGFTHRYPYHAYVPSFGDWGFILASQDAIDKESMSIDVKTKYLDHDVLQTLFIFEKDLLVSDVRASTLDDPVVLNHYLRSWKHWQ